MPRLQPSQSRNAVAISRVAEIREQEARMMMMHASFAAAAILTIAATMLGIISSSL